MNEKEYENWEAHLYHNLYLRYSDVEIYTIKEWFRNIRSTYERDLIGSDRVDAFLKFYELDEDWNMFDALMIRAFVYAPKILREHNQGKS